MSRAGLLINYLTEVRGRKFRPGSMDCALFAAEWVRRATGRDLTQGLRGKYRSIRRGHELLREAGFEDHIAVADEHLQAIPPAMGGTGDIAVIDGEALGIVSADRVFVLRPDGLGHVKRRRATRAFRV